MKKKNKKIVIIISIISVLLLSLFLLGIRIPTTKETPFYLQEPRNQMLYFCSEINPGYNEVGPLGLSVYNYQNYIGMGEFTCYEKLINGTIINPKVYGLVIYETLN
jgi:hypothetical protein